MNSSHCDHLSQDLIFRTLDEELTAAERLECEAHLAVCEACHLKLAALRAFSLQIELAVHEATVPAMNGGRRELQTVLESRTPASPALLHHPGQVMRRFGWGMGIAATLAFGVLLAPKHDPIMQPAMVDTVKQTASVLQATTFEVDGETFTPVPYSNADLPTASPHIVQMQVPVSSLADVGIVFEPVTNRVSASSESEGSVLADVLVGADGQPRGVHVLGFE